MCRNKQGERKLWTLYSRTEVRGEVCIFYSGEAEPYADFVLLELGEGQAASALGA